MNSIRKILDKILEVACILIFGIMTILVVYQVVTRYVSVSYTHLTLPTIA